MHERHQDEQYFFDAPTVEHLRAFVQGYESPCCLCAPSLGQALAEAGTRVRVLDVDERFASVPGFRRWDIHRPEHLDEEFDLILCDPPFFNVSLSRLFAALRVLARNDFRQRMLVSYLCRRATALTGTFARFGLRATGYHPGYQTVKRVERNEIDFFGNLDEEATARLGRGIMRHPRRAVARVSSRASVDRRGPDPPDAPSVAWRWPRPAPRPADPGS